MTLAEKHYEEHRDPHNGTLCCKCLRRGARYYAIDDYTAANGNYKADDCNDYDHSQTCWLCKRCLREIGAQW